MAEKKLMKTFMNGEYEICDEVARTTKADIEHKHSANDVTSGTLSIERGGTGAATALEALNKLGISWGEEEPTATGTPNTIYIQINKIN